MAEISEIFFYTTGLWRGDFVGVFAYNTLNFIVLRYVCGCLGRWHFGMSDMVRLFGVPFGIQKFFFTLMSLFDFLKSIIY